jgi:hypothetical protein
MVNELSQYDMAIALEMLNFNNYGTYGNKGNS